MQYVIPDWIQDGEKLLQRITENQLAKSEMWAVY